MSTRIYRTDIDDLRRQASTILSSSDEAEYLHKVAVVNLILRDAITVNALAAGIGVQRQTISNWLTIVDTQGFEALHEKPKAGRPTTMTEELAVHIDALLQEDNPKLHGYNVWDGPSISSYLKNECNVEYSVRSCQRLLNDLGYAQLRPQTFPSKDPELEETEE